MNDTPATESPPLRPYHIHAWCDRTFTASFSLYADSPADALANAKKQVHDAHAEECDNGYPWDTFTIEDGDGELVAREEPPDPTSHLIEPVRELLAHIEDLASDFSISREIGQSSYVKAVQRALVGDAPKTGAA